MASFRAFPPLFPLLRLLQAYPDLHHPSPCSGVLKDAALCALRKLGMHHFPGFSSIHCTVSEKIVQNSACFLPRHSRAVLSTLLFSFSGRTLSSGFCIRHHGNCPQKVISVFPITVSTEHFRVINLHSPRA